MGEQLELFSREPFSVRLDIQEAMRIFWENYWCNLPSAITTKATTRRIMDYFKGRFIDTITKHDIENYRRSEREKGFKESTINKGHMVLERMFNVLKDYRNAGHINGVPFQHVVIPEVNPCALVPKVSEAQFARREIMSEELWKKIVYYADDEMMDRLIIYLDTGLRPCDVSRLTSANVDFKRSVLTGIQHKTITTKNPSGAPYLLKMTSRVSDILLNRIGRFKPGAKLFPPANWQKRWKKLRELAGCPWLQRRDLRRTKGTFMLDHGTDARTVADSLGLTTLRLLPNYTPRTLKHQTEGLEKLEKAYEK